MPIRWTEDADGNPIAKVESKRGRKRRDTTSTSRSLLDDNGENSNTSSIPSQEYEGFTLSSVFKAAARSVSDFLTGKSTELDPLVRSELARNQMDPDEIMSNKGMFSSILTGIADRFREKAAEHDEETGEFGGTGSIGEQTIKDSKNTKNIK